MKDLISVIIPVYNVEKYLRKCIESVRRQTYTNLEIILVDDGSTDSSSNICDEYQKSDSRITVIHKKNGGLSSARNVGLKVSQGNYITFLDSDDYISPTNYEELYNTLDGKKDRIACTSFRRVDENGRIYEKIDKYQNCEKISNVYYLRELLLHIGDTSTCTKLFPREILEGNSFNEDRLNEDFLFMINLIDKFNEMAFTSSVGYFYLMRKNSTSSGYGKAVIDMATNAIDANIIIQKLYPNLSEEGYRFALFQNMAYLLLVPKNMRNISNQQYTQSLYYLKNNFFKYGLKNKFLLLKNKLIIIGLIIAPNFIISLFQRKHHI